ncbi:MAG: SCO family protein [Flavisolibacter sp.]
MSRKQIFYTAFFSVLVIGFIGTLSFVVPDFFQSKFPPISEVGKFSFVNQDGKTVTEQNIKGKVVVANYFFTTCKSICPRMAANLKPVYDEFKNEKDFVMLSHTCDPERDSVPVLRQYADSVGVHDDKWQFLTGSKDSLYAMARHGYKIDDPNNFVQSADDDFLHTQFIALVNKKGEVTNIYDGIKPSEMKEMMAKIKKLLKEE